MNRIHMASRMLCTAGLAAVAASAHAQSETAATLDTVVVTGSRVIADATQSPTPLTVVSTDQLAVTTPTNIADGLNKLPVFIGSQTSRLVNNANNNSASNNLNLRNFGSNRALILLDGQRIAPSNANGAVNIDTLPQALVQSIEVVTGGASAVYGSDAVTGVVNFILDKNFTGLKFNVNNGISARGDARETKVALTAGMGLFGNRGHIEGSIDYSYADPLYQNQRPEDGQDGAWTRSGAGTAANPFVNQQDGRLALYSYGGKVTACGTGCLANNTQFVANGILGPFYPGITTGTANISSGGDGVYNLYTNITAATSMLQGFGRVSFDLTDNTVVWVNARGSQSSNKSNFTMTGIQAGADTFFKNNPYLPAAAQALLNTGTGTTFKLGKYNDMGRAEGNYRTEGDDHSLSISGGFNGKLLSKYDWTFYFGHGQDRVKVDSPVNVSNQLLLASSDVVLSGGTPVCRVSTTAFANLYPGCVPSNHFGPTSLTTTALNYFARDTYFIQDTTLDDVSADVAGEVFTLPAGPVIAALSGEVRWDTYSVESNRGALLVNCTGLNFCDPAVSQWQGNTQAPIDEVSRHVWEVAAELGVPLLKDLPLIQSLSANLAGRYTNYSTSGGVKTWKIGLDWHLNDDLRFRATTSVDIRAPSLRDLYSPQQLSQNGFSDLHTGSTGTVQSVSTGNPLLIPETARTYSAGIVFTPGFISGFNASVDYYNIDMTNAISSIGGATPAIQTICESSGGTSPFCALYIRPFPFSNTSAANYPTRILSQSLNAAFQKTQGWDIEANYRFELGRVADALPGRVTLRGLINIQPVFQTVSFVGAPPTLEPVSKGHVTAFASYDVGNWDFTVQDRWLSDFSRKTVATQVFTTGEEIVAAKNYVDFNVSRKFQFGGAAMSAYLSVQNVFDTDYPVFPTAVNIPGLYYKGVQGASTSAYDAIGRYFVLGIRGQF
jgi:iron complex outermembrane receptor protein